MRPGTIAQRGPGMGEPARISLSGVLYAYHSDRGWVSCASGEEPSTAVIAELNRLRLQELQQRKAQRENPTQLAHEAERLLKLEHSFSTLYLERAAKLLQQVIVAEPDNERAPIQLSSALRQLGQPEEALRVTEPFAHSRNRAMVTTRAASYCDLGEWARAKKLIGTVLAWTNDAEAMSVMRRIKAARPDLSE